MKKIIYIFLFVLLFLSSCYYDSEEAIFPKLPPADTSSSNDTTIVITFSKHILPTINNYCISCHNGGNSVTLTDYSKIKNNAQKIYGSISHAKGFLEMPQGSAKLSDKYIAQFKKWMDEGYPEN